MSTRTAFAFPLSGMVAGLCLAAAIPALSQQTAPATNPDPLQRKVTDKEYAQQQKRLRQEMGETFKKWLNEDVVYIISDEERKAFLALGNDEERENFIENFWLRRNPSPESPENTFREEHYQRIAYANEHFAAGKAGWRTDRGHIYISFGKPDSIDSHPSGGSYERPIEEGGGNTSTYPFEVWHYRYIEGIGDNIDIEFVDTCMCSDYHLTIDRSEKDALLHVPGAGQTLYESLGRGSKADRFNSSGLEKLGAGPLSSSNQSKQFDRIAQYSKLLAPPVVKFKDMEQYMTKTRILSGPPFPFDVRTDFVKVTNDTVLVPVTLQIRNREITFANKDGVAKGTVNILGRVTTLTGRVAQTFEDTVEIQQPAELLDKVKETSSIYWKSLPLRPGRYRVDIVIKDVNNPDHVGVYARGVDVPKYDDDKLASSTLILADKMERVASKDIGTGNFVIGNTKIYPRVGANPVQPAIFKRNQRLNFWMQVYNLGIDEKSKQNGATIEYEIVDVASNKQVLNTSENSASLSPNSDQITLEKSMPLASLEPGKYKVTIKVNDSVTKQELAQSVPFVVE